jgi:hypothetical protein
MNDIIFEKQQGGLARPLAGEDHISGLLFYSATKPSGWTSASVRQVTSIEHAVQLGIAKLSATFGVMYYHIEEFFRINPGGTLYVGIFTAPAEMDFEEIKTMQRFTAGKLRQIGIYLTTAIVPGGVSATADIVLVQGILEDLEDEHMPLVALIASDWSAISDLTTLDDLRYLDCPKVSAIFGQDGAGDGYALFVSTGKSITCLGAALGAVSAASVHENIGWVKKFNMSEVELEVPAFANGDLVREADPNLIETLNTRGYVFLKKHVGISGTYFNDTHTCVPVTSDYAYIENNRTMDKAIRGIRTYVLPQLNGPVKVDPVSGKLDNNTIKYIEDLANQPLVQMTRDGELSGFKAVIDPDQDVLATSELLITVINVPIGVSRTIRVKIGFGKKV